MIETLLGGLLGGAFRLAPEILKWLDRNGERSHELSMQDKGKRLSIGVIAGWSAMRYRSAGGFRRSAASTGAV